VECARCRTANESNIAAARIDISRQTPPTAWAAAKGVALVADVSAILLVARLLLALVFVVAGLAKLFDIAGSRRAVGEFGVPERLAAPLGTVLPFVELGAGLALVPTVTARIGALVALALLSSFVVAISVALARGHKPECHCFGHVHSAPAGWPTLLRNIMLIALTACVLAVGWSNPGASATGWIASLDATQAIGLLAGVGIAGAVCFLAWFSLQLLYQNGRLLARIEAVEGRLGVPAATPSTEVRAANGLPVGSPAPGFSVGDLEGEARSLESILSPRRPVLLVFSDPGCGPCTALLPEIGVWQRERVSELTIVLVSRGDATQNQAKAAAFGLSNVLLQEAREIAELYQAHGTPSAVLVDGNGRIASPLAGGADAIRGLLAQAVGRTEVLRVEKVAGNGAANGRRPAHALGDPAPDFTLADLDGQQVSRSDFHGRNGVLLLFWNPRCGFCQRMLERLKAFEAKPPDGAPELLIVSTGPVEENRAQGLRSTVLLDENFRVGAAFGATGTPTGLLIDAEGRVTSSVAGGADQVMALTSSLAAEAADGARIRQRSTSSSVTA
jgi:peroxiredoxin/uncharacterized membrane protein YphA (DoxX/SURF4 family)